ncbi:hypothetical protein K503DRAFT_737060 [Rhizopogon vinicolor AM-OR11-026]|uniref:Uncharacterized protein n=1 Tax=Rhizopogon vinicolor AM-OR11-026 TaxID=1314800 RepID=A0A1B7N724_9AGAM|nr:hypothetical protein K503DRAFT_737060 [Rhizopogon vinicolor AM-OR11-026]
MEEEHKTDRYDQPPPYRTPMTARPPSGFRIPLNFPADSAFPSPVYTREPPCRDADGTSPIFIGSAIFQRSVHPCKIAPHLSPPCHVPYGGSEVAHNGRYDLLPFDPDTMEWVLTSFGRIPPMRDPVQGGYEENGAKLYHALARVQGTLVPGKTGEHLEGCNVAFGNGEHVVKEGYEILCWR